MKIGLLQCDLISNDILQNSKKLLEALRKAHKLGAELCVSSELSLCAAPPTAQLLRPSFIDFCQSTLTKMALTIQEEGLPPLLLGAPAHNPMPQGKPLHNCSIFLRSGKSMVIGRKVLLNADTAHDDPSYFESGVSCGVLQYNGWRFAVTIGEDIWNDRGLWRGRRQFGSDPIEDFMTGGADAIINMSSVPFSTGSTEAAHKVLAWAAKKYRVPVVSVNQIGFFDGVVYPGLSMAFTASGALSGRAKMFDEDVIIIDVAKSCSSENVTDISIPTDEMEILWNALVVGVRGAVHKSGFKKTVLGLSGGIDSALVAAIAADAIGPENVFGVLMPSPYSSQGSIDDSILLADNLGLDYKIIPIEKAMKAMDEMLEPVFNGAERNKTEENIQSRIRGNILMAISNKQYSLLLNTGNRSEASVGYSTLYGDSCGALAVIGDLYKQQVYALSSWYNKHRGKDIIPQIIIDKEPSAELSPGQKDSDSLPPYHILDTILSKYQEDRVGPNELVEAGFDRETVHRIIKLFCISEFKRYQAPPKLYVSPASWTGNKMPISIDSSSLDSYYEIK